MYVIILLYNNIIKIYRNALKSNFLRIWFKNKILKSRNLNMYNGIPNLKDYNKSKF